MWCYVDDLQIRHILIKIFDKYILIDICKMSSDLEIIMMAASILEKSGFRLILSVVLMSFLVTQSLYNNLHYKVFGVIITSVVLLQNDIDLSGCVTNVCLKLFKIKLVLISHFNGYSIFK